MEIELKDNGDSKDYVNHPNPIPMKMGSLILEFVYFGIFVKAH